MNLQSDLVEKEYLAGEFSAIKPKPKKTKFI